MKVSVRFIVNSILIAILLFSVFMLSVVWDDGKIIEKKVDTLDVVSSFSPRAKIKSPTVLFGSKSEIDENSPFFLALITDFWVDYKLKVNCKGCFGEYKISSYLEPISSKDSSKWRKRLPYEKRGLIGEVKNEKIRIDLNYVIKQLENIQKEVNVVYTGAYLVLVSEINVTSNHGYRKKFTHELRIKLGNSLAFENLEMRKREDVTKKVKKEEDINLGAFSLKSTNAKYLFASTASLSIFGIIFYERRSLKSFGGYLNKKKSVRSFKKKYGSLIVKINKVPSYNQLIMVESLEDLGRLAYELEKPIFETHDIYCVYHDGQLFAIKKVGVEDEKKKMQT